MAMSIDESKKLTSDLLACIDEGRGDKEWQSRFHKLFKAHASPDDSLPDEIKVQRMHVLSSLLVLRRPSHERILRMRYSGEEIMSYRKLADSFEVSVSKICNDEKNAIRMMHSMYRRRGPKPLESAYTGGKAIVSASSDFESVPLQATEQDVMRALSQTFDI